MKQLSQNLRTGKLSIDDVPAPYPQAGEVLVANAYSLISAGTERTKIETGRKSLVGKALSRPDQVRQVLQSFNQIGLKSTYEKVATRLNSRSPLGYSSAGTVIDVGLGVTEFKVGDQVACGGGSASHAEVIAVPVNLCVKVPEKIELDEAAFTTLGSIALQGVRLANVHLGEIVVVIGLGLLGQMTIQILKSSGSRVIGFDLNVERCQLARQLGAEEAFNSAADVRSVLALWSDSHGADAVIITAGTASNHPIEMAGELCREKGSVVVVGAVGLNLPREPYYHKELSFQISRSYGPGRYDPEYESKGRDYPYGYVRWTEKRNMQSFLHMVAEHKINLKPLITHRFKLEQAEEAYGFISGKGTGSYLGVVFSYGTPKPLTTLIQLPNRQPINNDIGIGVIGAGNFAQSMLLPHLKNQPGFRLKMVATLSPLESRDAAERFKFGEATTNPQEILDDKDIRAVVIATRHDSHADLAVRALNAGKAIHLEKPLALNQVELDKIVEAYCSKTVGSNNLSPFLMVGFNRRFAPMVQRASAFLNGQTEPLAMTYRINAGLIARDHWTQDPEIGGGRIIGEVCHFIDLLQFFAGAEVQRVFAEQMPDRGKYSQDNIAISLSLKDGSVGTILYVANGDRSLPKEYIEVYQAGKVAIIQDFVNLTLIHSGKKEVSKEGARDKGHRNEVSAWLSAIRSGKPEPVPFSMSVAATRSTFAVLESIRTGQTVLIQNESVDTHTIEGF